MQFFPIEYFVVDVTRWDPLLQWVEFRGGRHWMRRSERDLGFKMGFATDTFEFSVDSLTILDGFGKEIPIEIRELETAPEGFPDFKWLPRSKKALIDIRVPFHDDRLESFPLLGKLSYPKGGSNQIFSLSPKILSPNFLFETVSIYGPKLATRFTDFIETGSLFAHTSIHASFWFDRVTTIEISETLFDFIKDIPKVKPNVSVINGDSATCLPKVINKIKGPCVFFLDAHWSGDDATSYLRFKGYPHSTSHKGSGDKPNPSEQKPLERELELIYAGCHYPAMIILDDWDLIGKTNEVFEGFNWTHLDQEALREFFSKHHRTVFHGPIGTSRYIIGIR